MAGAVAAGGVPRTVGGVVIDAARARLGRCAWETWSRLLFRLTPVVVSGKVRKYDAPGPRAAFGSDERGGDGGGKGEDGGKGGVGGGDGEGEERGESEPEEDEGDHAELRPVV